MGGKIFAYCERGMDPSYFAEPLNALTNLAFIFAAIVLFRAWRLEQDRTVFQGVLIGLVCAIGIGSYLFHTHATRWAVLMDVIPITLFMLGYLWAALRTFLKTNIVVTIIALIAFIASERLFGMIECDGGRCLNGSLGYAPAILTLVLVSVILALKKHEAAKPLALAAVIFTLSLTFRTIDQTTCELTRKIGTHFLWHIFNGMTLFILTRALWTAGGKTKMTENPS